MGRTMRLVRMQMWTWPFLGLLILLPAGCGGASSAGPPASEGAASPAQRETAQAPQPQLDPSQEMMPVEAGPFLFGATQEQFLYYLRQSRLRYPGMEDRLRDRLVMPQREKTTGAFWIDPFEVSNEQFLEFLQQTGYRPRDPQDFLKHWEGTRRPPEWALTFPVVWVSVEDSEAFCAWRGARLPSEEEWEKAARGSDGLYFPWGDKGPDKETAVWGSHERPEPVGNRPGDVSPYEVYDLGGNVAEWTSSIANFQGAAHRVVRGGAFNELAREMVTYQRRMLAVPAPRSEIIGFRCAFSR